MNSDTRRLSSEELETEFESVQIFYRPLKTRRTFHARDFKVPKVGPIPVDPEQKMVVRYHHISPLWMNNRYTSALN